MKRKFTDFVKEQRDIENDELYDVNKPDLTDNGGFDEKSSEILTLLREIKNGEMDIQDLLKYDAEELIGFISVALDYGLFNPLFKNN